jgi:hypothetical protein
MTRLRRVLAPLAAIWLFCQVGTVALAPVGLWIIARDPHPAECLCAHDLGAVCAMHHKPVAGTTRCTMRAANDSGTAVLTTLAGLVGLLPERTPAIGSPILSMRVKPAESYVVGERPVPPDPPPPRA